MEQSFFLLVHNTVSIISTIVSIMLAILVFFNGSRKTANITFVLFLLSVAVFTSSHVIGVNVLDPVISRDVLMFNLIILFIGTFNVHSVLAVIGKDRENKYFIEFLYFSSVLITFVLFIFPDLFLLPSVPKMYFPNYYNPGVLNIVRVFFLYGLCLPYMLYQLALAYTKTNIKRKKNQYKYLFLTLFVGYLIAYIPNFLIYNINIDPLIGMAFAPIFAVPLIYGSVKYELLNVKVIAKQAFFFSIGISAIGIVIIILNYSNDFILSTFPNYPVWINIVISSIIMMTISMFIWRYLRENDLLKYEFISTVTHKFRTPLTGIKWAVDNLEKSNLSPEDAEQIKYIRNANTKLVELTDVLVRTSETEQDQYSYNYTLNDLGEATEEILSYLKHQIGSKNINITKDIDADAKTLCDISRIKFVLQTFIENAMYYTKENGSIDISIKKEGGSINISVKDNGIGISKEEMSRVFSKFYRTSRARTSDTEGMGIGLFISKEIVLHHDGKIWAESEGIDMGTTFHMTLPIKTSFNSTTK